MTADPSACWLGPESAALVVLPSEFGAGPRPAVGNPSARCPADRHDAGWYRERFRQHANAVIDDAVPAWSGPHPMGLWRSLTTANLIAVIGRDVEIWRAGSDLLPRYRLELLTSASLVPTAQFRWRHGLVPVRLGGQRYWMRHGDLAVMDSWRQALSAA